LHKKQQVSKLVKNLPQEGNMKKKMNFAGLISVMLIIGLFFSGCENGSTTDSLDGTTWEATASGYSMVLTFDTPNYSLVTVGVSSETGKYTVSGDKITFSDSGSSFEGTINGDILTIATFTFTRK
jgi:hypothetical protein